MKILIPFVRTAFTRVPAMLGAALLSALFLAEPAKLHAQADKLVFFEGGAPMHGLLLANDGNLYGTASADFGHDDVGLLLRVSPTGTVTTLHRFYHSNPFGPLLQTSDGSFYGQTDTGGIANAGGIFKMTPEGTVTLLASFGSNDRPAGRLIQGSNGNFYGTSYSAGGAPSGTIFRVTPAGVWKTLVEFTGHNGGAPKGGLTQGSDGNFYGTTSDGFSAAGAYGTIFKMTLAGVLTTIATFNGANGSLPFGELIEGPNGDFYGVTSGGRGTVFKVTPDGVISTIVAFDKTNGSSPGGGLTLGPDGSIYGVTETGGLSDSEAPAGFGTVFKIAPDGTFTTVVRFTGIDGAYPYGRIVLNAAGDLFGMTFGSRYTTLPTVFKVSAAGVRSNLAQLEPKNGLAVGAGLVRGSDGNLYGTTTQGGSSFSSLNDPGSGVVFRLTPAGAFTVLANFTGDNGADCEAPLLQASDGNFYGAAGRGAANSAGAIFRISPNGAPLADVANFNNPIGGGFAGALIEADDGNFYGTTEAGGSNGYGSVYKVTRQRVLTTLYNFGSDATSLAPRGALVEGPDRCLYGTTSGDDSNLHGSVFKITRAGVLTSLAYFNFFNGSNPNAGLALGRDGNFYGTTAGGGSAGFGTIFQITPTGTLTTLVNFKGSNGASPLAELVLGDDGNFYGTTSEGGDSFQGSEHIVENPGYGTVFRVTPEGQLMTLYSFYDDKPVGGVVFSGSQLYGATASYLYTLPMGASAPSVLVGPAQNISARKATVTGNIAPGALATSYVVEFGLTEAYGKATAAQQVGSGVSRAPASGALAGLAGHTLYHYTITATNAKGTARGRDATFVTADLPPIASPIHAGVIAGASATLDILASVSDPDQDAISVSKVGKPAHGRASIVNGKILYVAAPNFSGTDTFSYEVSDGFGGVSTNSVVVRVKPASTPVTLTVGVNDPTEGAVDLPASSTRQLNSQCAVTARPNRGYAFTGWTGADANGSLAPSTDNPLTFTVTPGLSLTANFAPNAVNATIVALKGGAVPGLNGATFSRFGVPETGAFSGAYTLGGNAVSAIFGSDGGVLLAVGGQIPGLPGAVITKLGLPCGDAALVTLLPGQGGITAHNNVALVTGLTTGNPTAAFQTGSGNLDAPGLDPNANATVANFLAIDGDGANTFFLATLQGTGLNAQNNLAVCAIAGGSRRILVANEYVTSEGVTIAGIKTLVGSAGTAAHGRWRADAADFGLSLQYSFGQARGIYSVPASAYGTQDLKLLVETGVHAISGFDGIGAPTITSFGLPAFGSGHCAVLANLGTGGANRVTGNNNVALITADGQNDPVLLAREGDLVGIDDGGHPMNNLRISALQDPIVGAGGNVAFRFTASDSDRGASVVAIGYSADGATCQVLANAGGRAPGGGVWSSFGSLVLPKSAAGGPVFLGTLAVDPAAAVNNANRLGMWGVGSDGALQLLFCDGDVLNVGGTNKTVRSFAALAPGGSGSASGYDDAGNIAIVATFADGSQALVRVAIP